MSGMMKKVYLDKQANVWELIQKIHTDDYCYCIIRNVITNEQTAVTDWSLQRRYFAV